jgi:hypothetical protein
MFEAISDDAYKAAEMARTGRYSSFEHVAKGFDEIGYFAKHWASSISAEATAASFDDDTLQKWAAAFAAEEKRRMDK